ncbi:hypothetical protein HOLleu_44459 [Holothuria leucospilota]|uniref:Uncharacterized protein n=1 Tax=Holothuria leucospilota TaxID=206669 RepID=A0A9Q0Y8V5_HOLLE|nr:hypothetical protein HOLleu_44459 [Holothuria leucospilota]
MGTKKRTKTVDQKYKDAYIAEWPVIRKSQKGDTYAFCTSCTMDFSVSHGGRNDCLKHVSTDRHRRNSASITSNSKILDFVTRESQFEVINAEVFFSNFIVEHNLPIGICDHVGPLFKKMFTDSKIAQQYGCARTKTSAILNTLGDHACRWGMTRQSVPTRCGATFVERGDMSLVHAPHRTLPMPVRMWSRHLNPRKQAQNIPLRNWRRQHKK